MFSIFSSAPFWIIALDHPCIHASLGEQDHSLAEMSSFSSEAGSDSRAFGSRSSSSEFEDRSRRRREGNGERAEGGSERRRLELRSRDSCGGMDGKGVE